MRHYELKAKIRTVLDKDYGNLDEIMKDEEKLRVAVNDAYDACVANENESNTRFAMPPIARPIGARRPGRTLNRDVSFYKNKYGDIAGDINKVLVEDCNEQKSLIAEMMTTREIIFALKFSDGSKAEEIIRDAKQKAIDIIKLKASCFLLPNEHYVDCKITEHEIASTEFYFTALNNAENFGLDIDKYMKKIKEYKYGADFDRMNRVHEYVMDFEIEKKLSYDEFLEKYKMLLYNRNFFDEIKRIYKSENKYNVKINPVHYEFTQYDPDERIEMFKALATALYSNNRLSSRKIIKLKVDVISNYANNDTLNVIFENSKGSFVFIEFEVDRFRNQYTKDQYWGRTQIRTNELTDNILALKDDVQFAFYIDKYQDKVRSGIYDELSMMNIVKFEDRLIPDKAIEYVENLAHDAKVEVNDDLKNRVKLYKEDINKEEAKVIFEDYKDDIIKNKYFPEYKDYYENKGGVENIKDPYEELMAMPGLQNIKKVVNDVINLHELNEKKKARFLEYQDTNKITSRFNGNTIPLHMVFMGNPGTCKTTVAKMIAKIFKSKGIIRNDRTEIYGIDGRCCHLENAFKYAYGGILFIDEVYGLLQPEITDLVALMENHRNDVMVILAGYTDAMQAFMRRNEGLNSRIKYKVEFEDYSEDELWEIMKYQAKNLHLTLDDGVKEKVLPIFASAQCDIEAGNGRLVRNMLDEALMNQAKRIKESGSDASKMSFNDLNKLTSEDFDIDMVKLTGNKPLKYIGNADPEKELNNMIGLNNIKSMVEKIVAAAYMNNVRKEKLGITNKNFISTPMHLAFLGNPGTAKTTVARLLARILKKKGIIKKEKIHEVGRKDLIAKFVGHTAPLVKSQFEKAKGGVLFIDEAYSLVDEKRGGFADEAVNTIIAEMENHRDDVIVIFAGYTDKMRDFFSLNEGLRSRISYTLEFEDYSEEELYQIFEKMVSDEELIAAQDAKEEVKKIVADVIKGKDYGNGRYIRKLLENARLNMDLRLSRLAKDDYSFEELKTLTKDDFKEIEDDKVLDEKEGQTIGFAA